MSLKDKTKAELLAIIAADRDVVMRARQALDDLRAEREKRHAVEVELRDLKAKPVPERIVEKTVRVEVPVEKIVKETVRVDVPVVQVVERRVEVPIADPTVMAEIEQLRAQIAAINYDDLKAAKEYRRRIEMARE